MLCHIYCTSFLSEKAVITKYFALDSNNHPLTAHQKGWAFIGRWAFIEGWARNRGNTERPSKYRFNEVTLYI